MGFALPAALLESEPKQVSSKSTRVSIDPKGALLRGSLSPPNPISLPNRPIWYIGAGNPKMADFLWFAFKTTAQQGTVKKKTHLVFFVFFPDSQASTGVLNESQGSLRKTTKDGRFLRGHSLIPEPASRRVPSHQTWKFVDLWKMFVAEGEPIDCFGYRCVFFRELIFGWSRGKPILGVPF